MGELIQVEVLVLELLLIASVVGIVVRRFRFPYTVALVLVGLALSLRSRLSVELAPELILSLFLPPLVFEAAYHLNIDQLRRNLPLVLLLAVPGVILNMVLVGGIVAWGAGLALPSALVFGALIAATDPVAVITVFRKLGVPKRLQVLLEGESLFNDGTAIVVFNLAVAAVVSGRFAVAEGLADFIRIGGGGAAIGLALGWGVSRLIGQIDDYLVETTLTTVLAFGSYLLAEQLLHVSGVLAVVCAGLVNGNIGPRGMSPTTRIVVLNFWEYVAFLANSAVFLLIGLQVDFPLLFSNWRPIAWGIGAVLLSRGIVIYLLLGFARDVPRSWKHVLYWGGLRGAIALALALSLPATLGVDRDVIATMAFGVVLFTLLGQGLTLSPLLRRLRLVERGEDRLEYERRNARALAFRAGFRHLARLHDDGLLSHGNWNALRQDMQARLDALTEAVTEALEATPDLQTAEIETASRETLRAQRSALANFRRDGIISDATYEELLAEIDIGITDPGVSMMAIQSNRTPLAIRQLIFAVIQARDLESASNALAARGIPVTRIPGRGGFLGKTNYVLMIGVPESRLDAVVEALQQSCRSRVEYLAVPMPLDNIPMSVGTPVPVEVRGATVMVFDVERYEEM
jgi:CPA1 family monovalent cation:H+ antiporter